MLDRTEGDKFISDRGTEYMFKENLHHFSV